MEEAAHWARTSDSSKVQCLLCPHGCLLESGETGRCRVRKNIEGKLYSLNYGQVTAMALDPIEKKPLARFQPGTQILSLGTFGCNLRCSFCQNWQIAQQGEIPARFFTPEEVVAKAKDDLSLGNIGIAYTYSEPLMWFEYVLATAKLARQAGLKNVLVTNGYLHPQPLRELLPFIDAVNLDLKAFTPNFYQEICQGELAPVLRSVQLCAQYCHLEITTLLIPEENDSIREITNLAQWIAKIDSQIPLHLTRYFPHYKLQKPPTKRKTMLQVREIAAKYLEFVYLGNL